MDVRFYKLAHPVTAPWPGGGTVKLHPLPPDKLHLAEIAAHAAPPRYQATAGALSLVAMGIGAEMTPDALSGLITPAELGLLLAYQQQAQRRAEVDTSDLREWLRRSVNDITDVIQDGVVAWQCEQGPGQYYGRPPNELTQAQVAWFILLRDAFEHFHVGRMDDKGKLRKAKPAAWWLRQDYETRAKWQI